MKKALLLPILFHLICRRLFILIQIMAFLLPHFSLMFLFYNPFLGLKLEASFLGSWDSGGGGVC